MFSVLQLLTCFFRTISPVEIEFEMFNVRLNIFLHDFWTYPTFLSGFCLNLFMHFSSMLLPYPVDPFEDGGL